MISWKIQTLDASPQTFVLPVNPNQMDAPEMAYSSNTPMPSTVIGRRYQDTHKLVPQTQFAVLASKTEAAQWSFGGVLYSLYHVDQLESFLEEGRLQLTDHFNRKWLVYPQDFNIQRAPTWRFPERHTYSMQCLMVGRV